MRGAKGVKGVKIVPIASVVPASSSARTARRAFVLGLAMAGVGLAGGGDGRAGPAVAPASPLAGMVLVDGRGTPVPLEPRARTHRFLVIVFYSATCPCFEAHVERLATLARELAGEEVALLAVDSERHAGGAPALPLALAEGLPLMRDPDARLALRLGARFATESFVFDAAGALRFRGGIDDDRKLLHPGARAHLREALRALLSGAAPANDSAKALGCTLRLR